MSLINDENSGIHVASEVCDFLFASPQQTGRPSILRPSQKQNLPKSEVKPMKVTFQTPVRDPLTQKIMTPAMSNKEDGTLLHENCTPGLDELQLTAASIVVSTHLGENSTSAIMDSHCAISNPAAYPDDEMPVKSKGAYSIDFDNLDFLNPFASSVQIKNSPCKSLCGDKSSLPGDSGAIKIAALIPDTLVDLPSNSEALKINDEAASENTPSGHSFSAEMQSNSQSDILDNPDFKCFSAHLENSTSNLHSKLECVNTITDEVLNVQSQVPSSSENDVKPMLNSIQKLLQDQKASEKLLCNSEELASGMDKFMVSEVQNPLKKIDCRLQKGGTGHIDAVDTVQALDSLECVPVSSSKCVAEKNLNLDAGEANGLATGITAEVEVVGGKNLASESETLLEVSKSSSVSTAKLSTDSRNLKCPSIPNQMDNIDLHQCEGSKLQSSPLGGPISNEVGNVEHDRGEPIHRAAHIDSYAFDPELLNTIDPFKTGGSKLQNSPLVSTKPIESFAGLQIDTGSENVSCSSTARELDPKQPELVDPFHSSGSKLQNSPVIQSKDIASVLDRFDLEQLEMMDPFKMGGSKIQNSPTGISKNTDSVKYVQPIKLNSGLLDTVDPFTEDGSKLQMSPVVCLKPGIIADSEHLDSMDSLKTGVIKLPNTPKITADGTHGAAIDLSMLPSTETELYKFDPEKIDTIDPFKTGGSKLQNSPIGESKQTYVSKSELVASAEMPIPESLESTEVSKPEPVKLDFEFSDTTTKKSLPKKLGKRLGTKVPPKKLPVPQKKEIVKPDEKCVAAPEEQPLTPKAAYAFDWNKFDDPNFNPFGCGGSKMSSSPEQSKTNVEYIKESSLSGVESATSNQELSHEPANPVSAEHINQKSNQKVAESLQKVVMHAEAEGQPKEEVMPSKIPSNEKNEFVSKRGILLTPPEDPDLLDVDFKPAAEFGFEQSVEMDYLEQFGAASFKESALRKQSLYLKFDPLLRESPKKKVVGSNDASKWNDASKHINSFQSCSHLISLATATPLPANIEEKPKGLDLLGTYNTSDPSPFIKNASTNAFDSVNQFPLATNTTVGPIVEMLKYSQKDMDAAIEKIRQEVREKELEVLDCKKKHEKLSMKYMEMEQILSEFEGTITQLIDDTQKQKEDAKQEVHKIMLEKQQVQMDLHSTEKSFSDLFKRFEKQKDVIEGYRKNEEALKKCVEDYLARISKEEQRYQALKAHAEEKLNKANEEIAQVRSKSRSEIAAMHASMRKEQMRIHSLEQALEQKTKENDELTKICDDLIMKMEKA
ncbi:transforming acidic coiled-coil-containing protein 3 isoform X2 [Ambystoma mexicanum]|uniref:transforming acidic coiled-coil-containing protein 3 isoform X2 n=1 Tax=Ambystoma mexicanum TaxID=8296 RepID=UPI0037E8D09E